MQNLLKNLFMIWSTFSIYLYVLYQGEIFVEKPIHGFNFFFHLYICM